MRLAKLLSLVCATLGAARAEAAGLYFSERGVRPLGRGGAFVAGADDLGAIYYNPAGISDAGSQFLLDASWVNFTTDYTRTAIVRQRDPNTGEIVSEWERTFPTVSGDSAPVPIPTIAGSFKVHPDVTMAIGAMAPYSAVTSYPQEVDGEPAPQRYSLITLQGSALAVLGVWVAWKPLPEWSFGLGVEALVGRFVATTMYGACVPERFFCAPEQPEWDALTELDAAPIVAPSGNLGVKWTPHRSWRVGAAFQLPWWVRAPATVTTRLPATPAFESASQEGDSADVAFELPWALRLGVEFRPIDAVAIEVDGSMEGWAIHDEIVVSPDDLALANVVGFPNPFRVPEQSIPRNFQNSYSARLGAEFGGPVSTVTLTGRAGFSYESSAIPPEWMSVLTVDMQKLTLALGGSLGYEAWRFDVVYAHVFGLDVEVDAASAMSPQLSPVKANVSEVHAVNGGTYSARANVVGIGMKYSFDHPSDEAPPKKK